MNGFVAAILLAVAFTIRYAHWIVVAAIIASTALEMNGVDSWTLPLATLGIVAVSLRLGFLLGKLNLPA